MKLPLTPRHVLALGRDTQAARAPRPRTWMPCRSPIATRLATIDEPPTVTNGNGMPVTGAMPIVIPTLTNTWNRKANTIPAATIAP